MAGAIPSLDSGNLAEFYILRSIHFRQGLPREIFRMMSAAQVSSSIGGLVGSNLIIRRGQRLELSDLGRRRLTGLYGGPPPMIDHFPGALKNSVAVDTFEIEASVAREISRRVSGGGDPPGKPLGR